MAGFSLLAEVVAACLPVVPAAVGMLPLFMAGQCATERTVGVLAALDLWALSHRQLPAVTIWIEPLRRVADLLFPLYVLHFPLIVLWRVVFGWRPNDLAQMWQVAAGVALTARLLGVLLESQRRWWVRLFDWLIAFVGLPGATEQHGAADEAPPT